jgi:hypothetical protein
MSPTGIASPAAGPSSPRAQWPQMRGTTADAAANALAKGSPRGVTPTQSTAGLMAAGMAGTAAAAAEAVLAADGHAGHAMEAMKKLQRLSVAPPGVHGLGAAPGAPTLNQGGCRRVTAVLISCCRIVCSSRLVAMV